FIFCLRGPAEFAAVRDGWTISAGVSPIAFVTPRSAGERMKLFRPARRRHAATAGRRFFLLACCVAPISLLLARSGIGQSTSDTAPVYKQRSAPIEARIQ